MVLCCLSFSYSPLAARVLCPVWFLEVFVRTVEIDRYKLDVDVDVDLRQESRLVWTFWHSKLKNSKFREPNRG